MDNEEELQRQIWGGSDSELSDEEEEQQRHQTSVGSGMEDEYQEEARSLPKFKKSRREADAGSSQAPKRRRARKVQQQEVEAEPVDPTVDMTEEERRRYELNLKIDAAARPSRARGKKRKKDDDDVLDQVADREVDTLRIAMEQAANDDIEANRDGRPAVAKLKMLQEVTEVLQKSSHQQSIIDRNLLDTVKTWLEPLPDKSLPALNIQRAFFEVLGKMFIDTSTLKETGLGRIVLFYTLKNKRVTPQIKAQADNLIDQWSRPILKRSASYRDREVTLAEERSTIGGGSRVKLAQVLAQGRAEDAGRVRRNAVRIPERSMASFTVVPKSNVGSSARSAVGAGGQAEMDRRRAQAERVRKVQRKLELNKQKAARF